MKNTGIQKAQSFIIDDEVEYVPGSVVIKTIMRKVTGNIRAMAFDSGEVLTGKISPFDNLIQVIEGSAEVVIDDKSNFLEARQSIILPAHSTSALKGKTRFKVISTVIKSGYEEAA